MTIREPGGQVRLARDILFIASKAIKIICWSSGFCVGRFYLFLIHSVHVTIFFFCTPVHSSAQGMIAVTDNKPFRASQHFPSPGGTGSAVSAWLCCIIGLFSTLACLCANLFMGCRGFLKGKVMSLSPNPVETNSQLAFLILPLPCAG
jgi:hypothetical protein